MIFQKILLVIVTAITLSGCSLLISKPPESSTRACTMEAKVCPDGTFVGRVGPGCELAPCPGEGKEAENPWKSFSTKDIGRVHEAFTFEGSVPASWEVEAVRETEALNFYDPPTEGESNLDKSQIFVRYFRANDFLTLSTVTIFSREEKTVQGKDAILYDIEKKESVSKFPYQPSWRSQRHKVLDVRVSEENPSVFYVIAKRPDLEDDVFDAFVASLDFNGGESSSLMYPVAEFEERITKKPFGIYITPDTSPVPDDLFTGFHTGVDVEYEDITDNVYVKAIADGTIMLARWAGGYGGVIAARHTIRGSPYIGIYGHLDPETLPKMGAIVKQGDIIGRLGDGKTSETDGARKHLHFSLLKGDTVDIRGYVAHEEELNVWVDPQKLFTQR